MRRHPKLRPMLTVIAALVIAAVLGVTLVHLPIGPRKGQERGEYVQELRLSLAAVLALGDAAVHSAANFFSPSTDNPRVYATAEDVVALLDSYHESMEAAARLLMAHPLFFCRRDLGALGWAGGALDAEDFYESFPADTDELFSGAYSGCFSAEEAETLAALFNELMPVEIQNERRVDWPVYYRFKVSKDTCAQEWVSLAYADTELSEIPQKNGVSCETLDFPGWFLIRPQSQSE